MADQLSEEAKTAFTKGTEHAFGGSTTQVVEKPAEAQPDVNAATPVTDPAKKVETPVQAAAVNWSEIPDDEIAKILSQRTKGRVKSLEELAEPAPTPTAEELAKLAVQDKNDALAWAIEENIISREEYETGIAEKGKTNREIGIALLAAELREENAKITMEDVEETYRELNREELDEDNPYRKAALRQEAKLANAYRKDKFGKLDTLDEGYKTYRADAQRHKEYTKQVKTVFDELPKEAALKVPFALDQSKPDNKTEIDVKYTYDEADLAKVRKMMSDTVTYRAIGADKKDFTPEQIKEHTLYHLNALVAQKQLTSLLAEAARESAKATLAWAKNIPVTQTHINRAEIPVRQGGERKVPDHSAYAAQYKNSFNKSIF